MWQKVMGADYPLDIEAVEYDGKDVYKNEAAVLKRQQEWLKNVQDGDDAWFKDKFYDDPYYQYYKERDLERLKTEVDPKNRYLI